MEHAQRPLIALLLGVACAALVCALPARADGPITVCPAGCDYTTIDQGLVAAGAGDTVLVYAGVYTEQVALKSGVALVAPDGPQSTTVTYPFGPIVRGDGVVSASLEGFTIRGTQPMTGATGIQLTGGQVVISGCTLGPISAAAKQTAAGVSAVGVELTATGCEFRSVYGPEDSLWGYYGASAVGAYVSGGRALLDGNTFTDLRTVYSPVGTAAMAIVTSHTEAATLTHNVISRLNRWSWLPYVADAPDAPTAPRYYHAVGVYCTGDTTVSIVDNEISELWARGNTGTATGIEVTDGQRVTIARNRITAIHGSYTWASYHLMLTTVGISVSGTDAVKVTANEIGDVTAKNDPWPFYFPSGGSVEGIRLRAITSSLVANNVLWSLVGGDGTSSLSPYWQAGSGGDAYGIYVERSNARIQNNSLWGTRGGLCPDLTCRMSGCPRHGYSAGLYVADGSSVLALNNAIISATLGVTATGSVPPVLGYNAFWDTQADYAGTAQPGAGDLHVSPGLANPASGDVRLLPYSPLIDAGTGLFAPGRDFEGELRPADGDGDGTPRVDIGADEYYPWLTQRYIFPLVVRSVP